MIRVAMVNTVKSKGGAARMAALLAQTLHDHFDDIEVTLYHCEDRLNDPPFCGLQRRFSRPVNALLARLGGSTWVWDMGVAQEIIDNARDADILHIHNLHGYYLDYPALLSAWRERPVVWTMHDMWGLTGRCGFSHECEYWRRGCAPCPLKAYYPPAWVDRARYEFNVKTDLFSGLSRLAIVSPSQWLADLAIERKFGQKNVHVIPNPIDTDSLQVIDKVTARKTLNLPEKKFIALFVAADCADSRKGYKDFAYAVKAANCMGVAVGKPPRMPKKIIQHTGPIISRDLINQYYCAADVYVIPSYADNYPNTVIEALACGTPVIGYKEGGIPSQLSIPYCACVDKGDIRQVSERLIEMIQRGGKTLEIGKKLSREAIRKWKTIVIVSQYKKLYHTFLEQN